MDFFCYSNDVFFHFAVENISHLSWMWFINHGLKRVAKYPSTLSSRNLLTVHLTGFGKCLIFYLLVYVGDILTKLITDVVTNEVIVYSRGAFPPLKAIMVKVKF